MTLQIIILNTNTQSDGSFSVSGVFWLTAPANNIAPNPTFISQAINISDANKLLLQQGTIIEKSFNSGLFIQGTDTASVQAALSIQFAEAQTALDATNTPIAGLVGMEFDGTTWNNPGPPSSTWISAQTPPLAVDGTHLVSIAQRQSDGLPQIAIAPTVGSETIIASHNLCDKCSWFGDSVRITDETLIDSGDGYTFNSQHTHWIDAISGRFYDDDGASNAQKAANPSDPHGYLVVVKVGGVEQTMREPFETSGGDYEVIWETGQVHFFSIPTEAPVVSYSYAEGSTFYVRPVPGKVLRVLKAEADVSVGCIMTDAIHYSVYALVDAVAPELVAGNMVPSGTMIPVGEAVYKRMGQISAEAQGAYPAIEVFGASDEELAMSIDEFRRKSRGTKTKVQALPFNYSTTRDLSSAAHMEIRVHLQHDHVFIGDSVTVTFYCVSKDEV